MKLLDTIKKVWNKALFGDDTPQPAREKNPLLGESWGDFVAHIRDTIKTKEDATAAFMAIHAEKERVRLERENTFESFMSAGQLKDDYFEATRGMSHTMRDLEDRKAYLAGKFKLDIKPSPAAQTNSFSAE